MTGTFSKGYRLAFFQGFEAGSDDIAEVDEQVGAAVPTDKAISFAFVEPLNGSVEFV